MHQSLPSPVGVAHGIASASQHLPPQIDAPKQQGVHSSIDAAATAAAPVGVAGGAAGAARRAADLSYDLLGGTARAHVRRYANIQEYLRSVLENAMCEEGTTTPAASEEGTRKDVEVSSNNNGKDARRQEDNMPDTFPAVSESNQIRDLAEMRGHGGRASFAGEKETSPLPAFSDENNDKPQRENASTFFDREREHAYMAPDGSILLVARRDAQKMRAADEEEGVVGGGRTLLSESKYSGRGETGAGADSNGDYRARHAMSGRALLDLLDVGKGKPEASLTGRSLTGIQAMGLAGAEEISVDEEEGGDDEDATMIIDAFSNSRRARTGQQQQGQTSQKNNVYSSFVSVGRASFGGKESGGGLRAHSVHEEDIGDAGGGGANALRLKTREHSNTNSNNNKHKENSPIIITAPTLFTKGLNVPSADEWIRTQLRRHRAYVTPITPIDQAELTRRSETIRVEAHRRRVEERYGHLRSPERARGLVSVLIPPTRNNASSIHHAATPMMVTGTNPAADLLVFRGESEGAEGDTVNINAPSPQTGRLAGNNRNNNNNNNNTNNRNLSYKSNVNNANNTIFAVSSSLNNTTDVCGGSGSSGGDGNILLVPASSRPLPYLSFDELAAINEMVENEMEEFKKCLRQQRQEQQQQHKARRSGSDEGSSFPTPSRRPESRMMLPPATGGGRAQTDLDYSLATLRTTRRRPNTAPTATSATIAASRASGPVRRTVPKEISRRSTSPFHTTTNIHIDGLSRHAKKGTHSSIGEPTVATAHLVVGSNRSNNQRRREGPPSSSSTLSSSSAFANQSTPPPLPFPTSGPEEFVQYVRQVAATRGAKPSDIYPHHSTASVGFEGSGDTSSEKVFPPRGGVRRKNEEKILKRSKATEKESNAIEPSERTAELSPLHGSISRTKRTHQQVREHPSTGQFSPDRDGGGAKVGGGGGSPVDVVRRRRKERQRQEESELSEWAHRIRREGFHI